MFKLGCILCVILVVTQQADDTDPSSEGLQQQCSRFTKIAQADMTYCALTHTVNTSLMYAVSQSHNKPIKN